MVWALMQLDPGRGRGTRSLCACAEHPHPRQAEPGGEHGGLEQMSLGL